MLSLSTLNVSLEGAHPDSQHPLAEGLERREPSYTVGRNVNWYNHYGEQLGGSLKN